MRVKLKLRGKVAGFVDEREQEISFEGETLIDIVQTLSLKFGLGVKHWQSSLLINGHAVQDPRYKLSDGDTVTLTLYPIIGGG